MALGVREVGLELGAQAAVQCATLRDGERRPQRLLDLGRRRAGPRRACRVWRRRPVEVPLLGAPGANGPAGAGWSSTSEARTPRAAFWPDVAVGRRSVTVAAVAALARELRLEEGDALVEVSTPSSRRRRGPGPVACRRCRCCCSTPASFVDAFRGGVAGAAGALLLSRRCCCCSLLLLEAGGGGGGVWSFYVSLPAWRPASACFCPSLSVARAILEYSRFAALPPRNAAQRAQGSELTATDNTAQLRPFQHPCSLSPTADTAALCAQRQGEDTSKQHFAARTVPGLTRPHRGRSDKESHTCKKRRGSQRAPDPDALKNAPGSLSKRALFTSARFRARCSQAPVLKAQAARSRPQAKKGRATIDAPRRRARREQPLPPRKHRKDGAPRRARAPRRRRRAGRRGVRL